MTNALIITLYGKLIKTTLELDIEIKKLQDKRGFLPDSLIAELADEHARRYACFIAQTSTGVYKFYTSAEIDRHASQDGSSTMVTHYRQATQCRQEQSRRRTQDRGQTRVAEAGRCILKLNKSEIDRLMKYIGRA
jgi:hypothetical protein